MHMWLTIVLVVLIGAGIALVVAVAGRRAGHLRGDGVDPVGDAGRVAGHGAGRVS